jgi:hypothetical protein
MHTSVLKSPVIMPQPQAEMWPDRWQRPRYYMPAPFAVFGRLVTLRGGSDGVADAAHLIDCARSSPMRAAAVRERGTPNKRPPHFWNGPLVTGDRSTSVSSACLRWTGPRTVARPCEPQPHPLKPHPGPRDHPNSDGRFGRVDPSPGRGRNIMKSGASRASPVGIDRVPRAPRAPRTKVLPPH